MKLSGHSSNHVNSPDGSIHVSVKGSESFIVRYPTLIIQVLSDTSLLCKSKSIFIMSSCNNTINYL